MSERACGPERPAVTLLSTAKAFTGIFEVIQTNAITSWTLLEPRPDVILFGDDPGTAELCRALVIRHVPDVATTEQGTPLLSDMFLRGQELATTPMVCWSNADIIFDEHLLEAARTLADRPRPAYVVGRRTDIDQPDQLRFDDGWQGQLTERAALVGELKPAKWIDWFLFTRGLFHELPPFAIGRPGYDPWLIWRASELGADVIDATAFVPAIHQRHDYTHVGSREAVFAGAEARQNAAIVDDFRHYHSIAYAPLRLDADGRVVPAPRRTRQLARAKTWLGHQLRFTRPLRRRLLGERATRQRRVPAQAATGAP